MQNDYIFSKIKWNKKLAIATAKKLKIHMTKKHWEIVFYMREFYKTYNITPTVRMFLKFIKKKKKIILTSQDLFILFPQGFIKYASQISGLPINQNCF